MHDHRGLERDSKNAPPIPLIEVSRMTLAELRRRLAAVLGITPEGDWLLFFRSPAGRQAPLDLPLATDDDMRPFRGECLEAEGASRCVDLVAQGSVFDGDALVQDPPLCNTPW